MGKELYSVVLDLSVEAAERREESQSLNSLLDSVVAAMKARGDVAGARRLSDDRGNDFQWFRKPNDRKRTLQEEQSIEMAMLCQMSAIVSLTAYLLERGNLSFKLRIKKSDSEIEVHLQEGDNLEKVHKALSQFEDVRAYAKQQEECI